VEGPGIGDWEASASVPTASVLDWTCGVNLEGAPKPGCSFPRRSLTKAFVAATEWNWCERCSVVHRVPSLIRILTVDDHPVLRKGLAALVNAEPDLKLVAEASNGKEAIEAFRSHQPDITLMDIQMPGMDGVEALYAIRDEFPDARIIVLTTYTGDAQVVRALKAGARAYVLKGHVVDELLDTIRAVHAGKKRIPPDVAAELADHVVDDGLTEREIEVLRLIAAGNANKQIADDLSISEATVKSRITNILSKLGANDRAHAVTIGLRRCIIDLDPGQK
jgi:DNA-binding NarL/FixJ family response regulator